MQYTAIFFGRKNDNFQMKNCDTFQIFAQNKDRGYTLERVPTIYVLKQKKKENNVYTCKPQFYNIKVRCKGVFATRTCFRDGINKKWSLPHRDVPKYYIFDDVLPLYLDGYFQGNFQG